MNYVKQAKTDQLFAYAKPAHLFPLNYNAGQIMLRTKVFVILKENRAFSMCLFIYNIPDLVSIKQMNLLSIHATTSYALIMQSVCKVQQMSIQVAANVHNVMIKYTIQCVGQMTLLIQIFVL